MYPHQVMLIESAVICKWKVWTWTEHWHGQNAGMDRTWTHL